MASTIVTKNSSTASAVPLTGDLTQGELAVNVTDKRLFTKNSGGTVVELGTNPASLALPNGTANGVAYLNGSKVVTTGSALTFDGANNFTVPREVYRNASNSYLRIDGGSGSGVGPNLTFYGESHSTVPGAIYLTAKGTGSANYSVEATGAHIWNVNSEQMRLTSTGLGIGTSSPAYKLDVTSSAFTIGRFVRSGAGASAAIDIVEGSGGYVRLACAGGTSNMSFRPGGTELMLLDTSGNLGLGVTPSAWGSGYKALQVNGASLMASSSYAQLGVNNYWNGTNDIYIASLAASYYVQSAGAHKWYNAPSGTAGNAITFTQAMTLDASGNLGIGTTSSFNTRAVIASANTVTDSTGQVFVYTTDTQAADVGGKLTLGGQYNSTSGYYYPFGGIAGKKENSTNTNVAGYLQFLTTTSAGVLTERARIDSSGNLLVGTIPSTASALGGGRLVSTSDGTNFAGTFYQSSTSSSVYTMRVRHDNTTSGAYIQFVTDNNVETGRIYDSAGTMQYASSSDARLKTNVQPMQNSLQSVLALNPCTFDMRRGEDTFIPSAGLIAQEVHEVYPYVVGVGGDDENTNPWSVDYGKLTPLLVAAIKEQQALIQTLTERITALEGK